MAPVPTKMNSYPNEVSERTPYCAYFGLIGVALQFLSHPLPLMFVAGISESQASHGLARARNDSVVSETAPPHELKANAGLAGSGSSVAQAASDEEAPVPDGSTDAPSLTSAIGTASLAPNNTSEPSDEPFLRLEANLRAAFTSLSTKPSVWKEGFRLDRIPSTERGFAAGNRRGSREDSASGLEKGRLFRVLVVDKVSIIRLRDYADDSCRSPT